MNSLENEERDHDIDDDDIRPERKRRFSISEAIGRMYKDDAHPLSTEHVKKLGDYIRFSNEGKPTRAEQAKRDRKLYEASGYTYIPETTKDVSTHGEVVGTVNDTPNSKATKKGLEVSLVNGQIVLDRSSLNRQVDRFDMNDSDDEDLSDLVDRSSSYRKHKVVSWSVEETKQFYDCLRRFGTDFFMMNKVISNRSRRELKNKYKTEEKRNPRLVSMILAVHLKEKMIVPDVPNNPPQESQDSLDSRNHHDSQEVDKTKESEKNTESSGLQLSNELQESDVLDDEDALTETSEDDVDSEDGLVIGDLL